MSETPVDALFSEVSLVIHEMKRTDVAPPVRIKSCLEHLRSSLEYFANDVHEKLGVVPESKIYFPFGKPAFIETYLSKLRASTDIINQLRDLITSIQPYHTGEDWLTMMCNLTNDAKHRRPIPLDQDEVITERTISAGGINIFHMSGPGLLPPNRIEVKNLNIFGQQVQDFTYEKGVMTVSGNGIPINLNITKEKKIRFHGHDYEVIPFLEKCLGELRKFSEKGYSFLNNLP